jgi:hypothetical protein
MTERMISIMALALVNQHLFPCAGGDGTVGSISENGVQPRLRFDSSSTNLARLMGPKALAENLLEYLAGPAFW